MAYRSSKWYIDSLPEFDREFPEYTKGAETCVVLPLFIADRRHMIEDRWVRAALWNMNCLFANTNVIELGWDVKLYVEQDILNDAQLMAFLKPAADAGLIQPFSMGVPPSPTLHDGDYRVGQSFYPVIEPEFRKYETVLIWDLDWFVARTSDTLPVYDMQGFTDPRPNMYGFTAFEIQRKDFFRDTKNHIWKLKFRDFSREKAYQYWVEIMEDLIGRKMDIDEGDYPILDASIHRFNPARISQGMKDFIRESEPLLGDDEAMMIAWWLKSGEPVVGMSAFPEHLEVRWVLHNTPDFLAFRERYPLYFSHISDNMKANPEMDSEWYETWKQDVGIVFV